MVYLQIFVVYDSLVLMMIVLVIVLIIVTTNRLNTLSKLSWLKGKFARTRFSTSWCSSLEKASEKN